MDLTHGIIALIFLLVIAVVSAMILKKSSIPYTIGLVAIGIGISWLFSHFPALSGMQKLRLNQELIMYILLPALIFDASINMDTKLLKKNLSPTLMLAAPGLLVATFITAVIVHWLIPISWGGAFLFGALISATDPVAVISLFEAVGAPKKLRILVDGESLFNDATAIVMFNIVAKIVIAGAVFSMNSVWSGAVDFVLVFLGGSAVGALIGFIVSRVIVFAQDDPLIEVAMSTIVAYMAFLVADKCFGFSGVMAVMCAGIVMAHYGATRFTPEVKQYMKNFWSFMSFVANSLIFLLLGFTEEILLLNKGAFINVLLYVLAAVIAVQIARLVVVFGFCPWYGRKNPENRISFPYQLVMFWGGLRGAVPLALVFGLPPELEYRELIVQITLGVVLFTVLVQGMTIRPLMGKFKLDRPELFSDFSQAMAKYMMKKQTLNTLSSHNFKHYFNPSDVENVRKTYQNALVKAETELMTIIDSSPDNRQLIRRSIWLQTANVERNAMESRYQQHILSEGAYFRVRSAIEEQLDRILGGKDTLSERELRAELPYLKSRGFEFKLWQKLPLFKTFFQQHLHGAALEDFTMLLCRMAGAEEALKFLLLLKKRDIYNKNIDLIEECEKYFTELYSILDRRLNEINQAKGDFWPEIAEEALLVTALSNELGVLSKLQADNEVSDEASSELTIEVREEIKKLTHGIEETINGASA